VAEEHDRRYGPDASWMTDPDEAWRRVKGQGRLTPAERAVLRRLAAWRERRARERDRPVSWTMPDRTLIELARRRPPDAAALRAERGMPDRLRSTEVEDLLAAIRGGTADSPLALGRGPAPEVQARLEVLGPLAQVLVAARAGAAGLAPTLVATRDEVEGFLDAAFNGGGEDLPLARGWRRELVGDALRDLARGELALAASARAPYLEEIPRATGPAGS
jgi:ribonuclease D